MLLCPVYIASQSGSPFFRQLQLTSLLLSIATEGTAPLFLFWNSSPSLSAPDYAPYFQALPCGPFCKPFIFIFIHRMGGVSPPSQPANLSTLQCSDVSPIYPLRFQTIAHSSALLCTLQKLNPFLFNRFHTLCQKTHRVVGTPVSRARSFQRRLSRSEPITSHESPVTSLAIRPIAAKRLWCNNSQSTRFLCVPGKQLRSPRCLRLGERTLGTARAWFPLQVVPGSSVLKLDRSRVTRIPHP